MKKTILILAIISIAVIVLIFLTNEKETIIEEDVKEEVATFNVYFVETKDNIEELIEKERVAVLKEKDTIEEVALLELIKGPTEEDGELIFTAIDSETQLNYLNIEERIAFADFSEHLDASGSATVIMIREQIEKTLLQFESIDEVVISINEETEEILQP